MTINAAFFRNNRQALIDRLGGQVIVLTAYASLQRKYDAAHSFEQEANFWYVTGIDQPNWQLIIDGSKGKSWLVMPDISDAHAIFEGSLPSDRALDISGVDHVISFRESEELLATLTKKHSLVYSIGDDPHAVYYDFVLNPAPRELWRRLERLFKTVQDCRGQLAGLRAIKQPQEIKVIKKSIKLTIDGFALVKKKLPTFMHEYEVEAEFTHHFRRHGADGHAYEPIVAGGENACTLHYSYNGDRLKKSDLLLLDVGAKVEGYPADITRTYAIATPTQRAKEVHAAVAGAHKDIIDLLRPGLSVVEYQQQVDNIMQRELIRLGLMKSLNDTTLYRKYFPHAISHGLGVDVHDALGQPIEFMPGMVLTVEPGIYIPEEGIGVRLEDDILITDSGRQNLSKALSLDL